MRALSDASQEERRMEPITEALALLKRQAEIQNNLRCLPNARST